MSDGTIQTNRYSLGRGKGYGYQVTWMIDTKINYVSFDNIDDAELFVSTLKKSIARG